MAIKWANAFVFVLAIVGLSIGLRHHRAMSAFLSMMTAIGPGHDPEEQVIGLLAFGIVAVSVLALIKVLIQGDRRE